MRALLLLVCLAACAKQDAVPFGAVPLRNPTAPIASQADVDLSRLQGRWQVVARGGDAPQRVVFQGALVMLDGETRPIAPDGPGRFRVADARLWVFWLDADNRTAAMGDPDGGAVWIMDRTGQPGERRAAARKILDWYGFDLGRMEDL